MSNYDNINLHKIARTAITQYGFDFIIAKPVLDEINALDSSKLLDVMQDRVKDLRGLLWSSIDNTESLDLDQLEYCERGSSGEIIIKVAIADVDLFVPKESQTDIYAARNGTSVYAGIEVFPLFPNRLSTELTSLLPDVDHYSLIIEFSVFRDGKTTPGAIYRGLICNKAKLLPVTKYALKTSSSNLTQPSLESGIIKSASFSSYLVMFMSLLITFGIFWIFV